MPLASLNEDLLVLVCLELSIMDIFSLRQVGGIRILFPHQHSLPYTLQGDKSQNSLGPCTGATKAQGEQVSAFLHETSQHKPPNKLIKKPNSGTVPQNAQEIGPKSIGIASSSPGQSWVRVRRSTRPRD
jgi:hypothetical protein